jgi:hypothetical protein
MNNIITPGKWSIENGIMYDFKHKAIFSGITHVADVLHDPDAVLISAAPDLLAACQGLLAISERYTNVGLKEVDAARAAIRKAVTPC